MKFKTHLKKKLLFEGAGDFGSYSIANTIHNGRKARVLYASGGAPQSGLALDNNPALLFSYNQRFLEIAESTQPKSVLLIGGGTFTLPTALLQRFTDTTIDVIEIDSLLPTLAKKYFDLQDDPRLHIIIADGRQYINNCQASYDLIIIDSFNEFDITLPLLTQQSAQQYARILNKDGLIAVNFIAKYNGYQITLAHQLLAIFGSVFSHNTIYPSDSRLPKDDEQNLLLVASNHNTRRLDYLQSAPLSLPFTPTSITLFD